MVTLLPPHPLRLQRTNAIMDVEARHISLFPLIKNREIVNAMESNVNLYAGQMGFGFEMPAFDACYPSCNSVVTDSAPTMETRKRSRELCFLGEDLSSQLQQQQQEIDEFVAQHTEKVRWELLERRKAQSWRLMEAVEQGVLKRLKAKEEEIEKIGKLNWVLEERVKSLSLENQIWRDLARTNETAANSLRHHLEQVLAQVRMPPCDDHPAVVPAEDAESCCDSSGRDDSGESTRSGWRDRRCRNCHKQASSVLLLPCRHLCLCATCGPSLDTCPICNVDKDGIIHVNMP